MSVSPPKRRFKSFGLRQAEERVVKEARTKLPGLVPIEPLLRPDAPAVVEQGETLPPLQSRADGAAGPIAPHLFITNRLYQGRDPANSDGFRACLELPQLAPNLAEEDGGTDSGKQEGKVPRSRGWRIVLLPECLQEGGPTAAAAVAQALVAVLQIPEAAAEALVGETQRGRRAVLEKCEARAEALRRAERLRDRGLAVRVTSRPPVGVPPEGIGGRLQGLAALCGGTLRGDLSRMARSLEVSRPFQQHPGRHCETGWRQTVDLSFPVMPEDPIEAYFALEREREMALTQERLAQRRASMRKSFQTVVGATMLCEALGERAARKPLSAKRATRGLSEMPSEGQTGSSGARTARAALGLPRGATWDAMGAMLPQKRISPVWKEACRLMRIFVFGMVGNEGTAAFAEEEVSGESIGTRDQVAALFSVWSQLDSDHSGRVNLKEFRAFLKRHLKAMRANGRDGGFGGAEDVDSFIHRLCDKVERLLLEKKTSFCVEDMMRLLWPAAGGPQLRAMKQWITELAQAEHRATIEPPPVLPREEFDGLRSMFRAFDPECRGTLSFESLVEREVIHEYQLESYLHDWDRNGDGRLSMLEFCEMMCPAGYRAHQDAHVGSLSDGRRVLFDTGLKSWRLEDGADELEKGWL